MKVIYRIERDGVIGLIESPDEIDPTRPLAEQLRVKIGFSGEASPLDSEDFKPRARLVVLELQNYIRDELGIER
jgi:hypothetical protein